MSDFDMANRLKKWEDSPGSLGVLIAGSATGVSVPVAQTRPNDTVAYAALDVVGASPAANLIFDLGLPAGNSFNAIGGGGEIIGHCKHIHS